VCYSDLTSGESIIVGRLGCHGGIYVNNTGNISQLQHAIKTGSCWTGAVVNTVANLAQNTSVHTTMTYNNGVMKSYLNGVLIASVTLDYTTYGMTGYGDDLFIGGVGNDYYRTNSDIYNIKCYTTELSADEVRQNFNALRGRYSL